jgi:DNA-binding MarR family transcriptional regulator
MSSPFSSGTAEAARRLHSAAIHLLRALRRQDAAAGIGPARLSALSVLVFGGPTTLGALADAEQVRPPTMSRIVAGLEGEGLVRREPDVEDGRRAHLHATAAGRRLLERARDRRVDVLAGWLESVTAKERARVVEAVGVLERMLAQQGAGPHRRR